MSFAGQLLEPLELAPDEVVDPLEVEVPDDPLETPDELLLEEGSPELAPDEDVLPELLNPELVPLDVAPDVLPDEDPPPAGRSVDAGPAQLIRMDPRPSARIADGRLNFMLAHTEQCLSSSATS